jgi:hypothetical protein
MGEEQEQIKQMREAFQKSRVGAVLRCTEIMIDSGRKDLAKQILATTHIDRSKLAELKAQTT